MNKMEKILDFKINTTSRTDNETIKKTFQMNTEESVEETVWKMIEWLIKENLADIDWFRE